MDAGPTKALITIAALQEATATGLQSLTIGTLASRVRMSKSGLFAHFGSKEGLQLAVIAKAADLFVNSVVAPAMRVPEGAPRLRALLRNHFDWIAGKHDLPACPFVGFQQEFDSVLGPARDRLAAIQGEWRVVLLSQARLCDVGIGADQLVFELVGVALAYQQSLHLLADDRAREQADAALDRLLGCKKDGA
jgi:AcrR family transcriptional regulator